MQAKIKYSFSAKIWKHNGTGGWHFVSLPNHISKEIREHLQWQEEGWGRMKSTAKIKNSEWKTAIWFDKKHNTYLLPIKSEVRKKNSLKENDQIEVTISL